MRRARGVGIGLIVAVLAGATAATATADLVADYRFDGDFESSVGSPSSASPSGAATTFGTESIAGCSRQGLSFPEGGGVFMGTKELVGSGPYTLIVQVRFDAVSPWVRVVNWFPSFAVDGGLYLHEGKLAFYDTMGGGVGGSTAVAPGQFAELAVTRDAAKMVRGYVNGVPQFSYFDASDLAVSPHPNGNVYFFVDNTSGGATGEDSAGTVARIRYYDTVLPTEQITNTEGCFDRRCAGNPVTIAGDSRANVILGTDGADVIDALGGNDATEGLGGDDVLCDSSGDDKLAGGDGNDRALGEAGKDQLLGGAGMDLLLGGAGGISCLARPARISCLAEQAWICCSAEPGGIICLGPRVETPAAGERGETSAESASAAAADCVWTI